MELRWLHNEQPLHCPFGCIRIFDVVEVLSAKVTPLRVRNSLFFLERPTGCKKHVYLSKILCCVLLHFTFIGDSENVSLMSMHVYLTVLFTVDWIMMCLVVHLPTYKIAAPFALGAPALLTLWHFLWRRNTLLDILFSCCLLLLPELLHSCLRP